MRASLEFEENDGVRRLSLGRAFSTTSSIEDLRVVRSFTAFLHLVNGNLGPGTLALPFRFALVGLPIGIACFGIAVCHYFYGIWLLLKIQKRLDEDQPTPVPRSFEDVGFAVLGTAGRTFVQFSVTALQLGVCIVFISFVSVNFSAALPSSNYYAILALIVACCVLLALLPNMEVLWPFSILSNILMVVSLLSVIIVSACELTHPTSLSTSTLPPHKSIISAHHESPLSFLACIFYSFEGIALVLPLANSMRPESADKYPMVLFSSMSFAATMFILVGSTGATTFTNLHTASITAFLAHRYEKGSKMATYFNILNVLVAVSVLLCYPLQLMPVGDLINSQFGIRRRRFKAISRLACTGFCAVIVLVLPNLGALIKLNGAIFSTSLGALPFLFHGAYTWSKRKEEPGLWKLSLMLDTVAISICCVVLVFGVGSAIDEIFSAPVNA